MIVLLVALIAPVYFGLLVTYGFSPQATDVGYAPTQPIQYSHALHAGELGIDCRYCHTGVEQAAAAAIPPVQTCINCHSQQVGLRQGSAKLLLLREAYYGGEQPGTAGLPTPWVRVHDLPDYVYFNHSAHISHGVGCVTCHDRIDRMETVYQAKPLSMIWCLECHRNPAPNLRPLGAITDMFWVVPGGADPETYGRTLMAEYNARGVDEMQSCSTCHR